MAATKGKDQKQVKYHYLINLAIASTVRAISLVFLIGQPSGIALFFLYTFPIIFWMNVKFLFMGFLGLIYC